MKKTPNDAPTDRFRIADTDMLGLNEKTGKKKQNIKITGLEKNKNCFCLFSLLFSPDR